MKIALIGYGKMGKAIETIAIGKGHEVVLRIDENNLAEFTPGNLAAADVAIEFTGPHSAFENVRSLIGWNVPVVCGSTGWTERLPDIYDLCRQKNGTFLYASNFSIGVNLFFEVNKKLAELMAPHTDYKVSMEEIHHTQKKDAPSGTAITLAEQILERNATKTKWVHGEDGSADELPILSKRVDPAPGTHIVRYTSTVDDIEIIHTAHTRTGFAAGAVLGAEFISARKGVFQMKDVLGI